MRRKLAFAIVAIVAASTAFAVGAPKVAHATVLPCATAVGGCAGLCPVGGDRDSSYIGDTAESVYNGYSTTNYYIVAYSCNVDQDDRQYEMYATINKGQTFDGALSFLGMYAYAGGSFYDEAFGAHPSGCSAALYLWSTVSSSGHSSFMADSGPMGAASGDAQVWLACPTGGGPGWPTTEFYNPH